MAEDWDLWAVVRSCNTPTTPSAAITAAVVPQKQLIPSTQPLAIEEKENVLATTGGNCFQELEQIMNPNVLHPFDGNKSPLLVECEMTESPLKEPISVERKPLQSIPPSTLCHHEYRKKKGRVVEVEAEELLHVDPWNWRKYGTKPIKASPFPRHYYKCSSDGNKCNAKKHIERCHTRTDKFIVSYSGEHNHSLPSRRNALSCTTRKKPYATRGESSFPSPSSDLPPSQPGTLLGEVGGDIENIYMGLEDFGGPKISCSVGSEFDWIWNTNDDLSFPEQLSPPATNKSGTLPQF